MDVPPSAAAWLVIGVAVLLVLVEIGQGRGQYERFRHLTGTQERQAMYRLWLVQAFCRYTLLGIAGLLVLRRSSVLWQAPGDLLQGVNHDLHRLGFDPGVVTSIGSGLADGLLFGMLLACLLPLLFGKRLLPRMLGDFDALLPRNRGEMGLCAALALNAGVGEEIFFRALLPLALWRLTGDAVTAVLAASLLFALMHTYQGVAGVAATGVIGLVLAAVYLSTRQLWLVMLLHALIDVRALLVIPWVRRRHR